MSDINNYVINFVFFEKIEYTQNYMLDLIIVVKT